MRICAFWKVESVLFGFHVPPRLTFLANSSSTLSEPVARRSDPIYAFA